MFEHLDYVYMPSRDVAADVTYFTEVLGGRLVFAIDGMGTRVAMVALTEESPRVLLAGHLDGDTTGPRLPGRRPHDRDGRSQGHAAGRRVTRWRSRKGPVCSFTAPGGQRLAIYQLTRPGVEEANFVGTARLLTSRTAGDRRVSSTPMGPCRPFRCRLVSRSRDRRSANCMVRGASRGRVVERDGPRRLEVVWMVTAVRPVFQKQGPETNCVIGGEKLGWVSCTAYAMAMGIDSATAGRKRPSGCKVRKLTGDKVKGLMLSQVAEVALEHYDVRVTVKTGPDTISPASALKQIRVGRGFVLQGNTAGLPKRLQSGGKKPANHAVWVNEVRGGDPKGAPEKALVYDPAADGRRPGIIKGETWWAWQDVLSFAAALRLSKTRKLGPGKFYAGFIEAPDVEQEVAHAQPKVDEALRTAVQAPEVHLAPRGEEDDAVPGSHADQSTDRRQEGEHQAPPRPDRPRRHRRHGARRHPVRRVPEDRGCHARRSKHVVRESAWERVGP